MRLDVWIRISKSLAGLQVAQRTDEVRSSFWNRRCVKVHAMDESKNDQFKWGSAPVNSSQNVLVNLNVGLGGERSRFCQQLVDQDSKRPKVNGLVMPDWWNYFRSDVFWCSTKGLKNRQAFNGFRSSYPSFWTSRKLLCKAEVDKAHVAVRIEKQVFRLEVSVANGSLVKVADCFESAGGIETSNCITCSGYQIYSHKVNMVCLNP